MTVPGSLMIEAKDIDSQSKLLVSLFARTTSSIVSVF